MKDSRPINLDLTTIKFPINAIVSILHRISGILLFVSLPILLLGLQYSLSSAANFYHLQQLLNTPLCKILLLGFLLALIYHLLAGLRHIIMDLGYGESITAGRTSAYLTLGLSVLLTIALGVKVW